MSFAKLWSKTPILMDFTDNSIEIRMSERVNCEAGGEEWEQPFKFWAKKEEA